MPPACRLGVAIVVVAFLGVPCAEAWWELAGEIPIYRPDPGPGYGPAAFAEDPYEAAQLGVDWMQAALCTWNQTSGQTPDCVDGQVKTCYGCHVQAEAVLGLARSTAGCYRLSSTPCEEPGDDNPLEYLARYLASTQRKDCILGTPSPACPGAGDPGTLDGHPPNLGSIGHYPDCGSNSPPASVHPIIQTAHGALNLAGYTRWISPEYTANLLALADWMVTRQSATGQWVPDRFEAPVDQGEAFTTGAAVVAMTTAMPYASPVQAGTYSASVGRAMAWAESAVHTTNQDRVFALWLLMEGGRHLNEPVMEALRRDLLHRQNPDGGWSERDGLGSNAYATGQALWILLEMGLDLNDPAVCAAVQWLVDDQDGDGSWPMGTTGVNTDTARPSRFTATMWPVMALGSLRRFGADLDPPGGITATCEESHVWTVMLGHGADSPCGLFALPDTYDLTVENDSGDQVRVDPSVAGLEAGESMPVTIEWRRVGPPDTWANPSTTRLRVVSRGSQQAGCLEVTEANFSIWVPPDAPPEAVGGGLRVRRTGNDLVFAWDPLPQEVSGYQLVALRCASRHSCGERPLRSRLDALTALAGVGPTEDETAVAGDGAQGGAELVFYKVRATSVCSRRPGPTCHYPCADRDACYKGCP